MLRHQIKPPGRHLLSPGFLALALLFILATRPLRSLPLALIFNVSGGYRHFLDPSVSELHLGGEDPYWTGDLKKFDIDFDGNISLGFQSPGLLGLELGAGLGPYLKAHNGYVGEQLGTYRYYFMPLLRLAMPGKNYVTSLGLSLGWSTLQGARLYYASDDEWGYYLPESSAFSWGLCYRIERFLDGYTVGLELGYLSEKFDPVTFQQDSGSNNSVPDVLSPLASFDGANPGLDFSGLSVKLIVGYWFPMKGRNSVGPAADRKTKAAYALPEDLDSGDRNASLGEQSEYEGEEAMFAGRNQEALELFRTGIVFDPLCADCWRGLGDAEDLLGHREEASEAYLRALKLRPENVRLRSLAGSTR